MAAIIDFAISLLQVLIQLFIWAVIVSAVLSWLITFDVVNMRNRFVYGLASGLDRLTSPVMRPFRRIIPSLGGIDITPILVILVLSLASAKLLTPLKFYLMGLASGA